MKFKNVTEGTFDISGQWYDYLRSWAVPTFAVIQSSDVNYDYSTDFDRKQRVVDYTTAQTNENANADTIVNSDGTESFIPNENIFLGALIALLITFAALIPLFKLLRKEHPHAR